MGLRFPEGESALALEYAFHRRKQTSGEGAIGPGPVSPTGGARMSGSSSTSSRVSGQRAEAAAATIAGATGDHLLHPEYLHAQGNTPRWSGGKRKVGELEGERPFLNGGRNFGHGRVSGLC